MESQPQNPEFRNNPENFHPCSPFIMLCLGVHRTGPCYKRQFYKGIAGK